MAFYWLKRYPDKNLKPKQTFQKKKKSIILPNAFVRYQENEFFCIDRRIRFFLITATTVYYDLNIYTIYALQNFTMWVYCSIV